MHFGDWEACITSPTGVHYDEFNTDVTEGNVVSCYIISDQGAEFRPCFSRAGSSTGSIEGKLTVDGIKYRGKVSTRNPQTCTWSGARNSLTTEQPFTFDRLNTTDDDSVIMSEARLKGLGEICIALWRVQAKSKHELRRNRHYKPTEAIHESCKKATLSHTAALGPPRTIKQKGAYHTIVLDEKSLVIFKFRYRSKIILEAEGIIKEQVNVESSTRAKPKTKVKAEAKTIIDIDDQDPPKQPAMTYTSAYRFERSPSL